MIDYLYGLTGGRNTIQAATDAFYRRFLEDEHLRRFFGTTDMPHLRSRQSMFLSMLLGGRVVYTGKEISEAHAHVRALELTDITSTCFSTIFAQPSTKSGSNLTKQRR